MSSGIQIIILAAGKGQRMGGTKQLLPYLDRTLLGNVIEIAIALQLGKPLVVLGHHADKIKAAINQQEVDFLINPNWEKGMGNTLAQAVKMLSSVDSNLPAVLVLLADQPKISVAHLKQLIKEFEQKKSAIVATNYPNGGGVPAIFDRSIFPMLMNLVGEKGARQIIREHEDVRLLIPQEEEIWDIDTPEDYLRLLNGN